MMKSFAEYIRKQNFQPSLLSIFFNPFYLIRKPLFLHIKHIAPTLKGKLMDFGCGRKPYENLFSVEQYIGVDMEQTGHEHTNSKIDVYYDGKQLPFSAESFDSIFCSEVLEHIFNPEEILPQLHKVLRPGGLMLMTVPFCWNEHEVPYDYGRYSSFGIKHLLEKNGFEILELKKSGNFGKVILQLSSLYIFELFRPLKKAGYLLSLVFIVPLNVIGSILLLLFPRNYSLYFNNVVLAKKIG